MNDDGGLINANEEGTPLYVTAGLNTDVFDGKIMMVDAETFFEAADDLFVIEDGFATPESDVLRKHLFDKQSAGGGVVAPSIAILEGFGDYGEEPSFRDPMVGDEQDRIRLINGAELAYLKEQGAETIPLVITLENQEVFGRLFTALDVDDVVGLEDRLFAPEGGFTTTVTDLAARTYVQGIRDYEAFHTDFFDHIRSMQDDLKNDRMSKERFDWENKRMDELYMRETMRFGAFPQIHAQVMVLAAAGVEQVQIPHYFDSDQILEAVTEQANAVRDFDLSDVEPLELVSRYERMLALNPQDSLQRTAILNVDGEIDMTRQMLRGQLIDAIKADEDALALAREHLSDDQVVRLEADLLETPGPLFNGLRAE